MKTKTTAVMLAVIAVLSVLAVASVISTIDSNHQVFATKDSYIDGHHRSHHQLGSLPTNINQNN